jgi:hypothetical protein
MTDRTFSPFIRLRGLLAALFLVSCLGVTAAGSFRLAPEINERGAHIGYGLARHYSLVIPGREARFFAGAVFSYTPDIDAMLNDPGVGVVFIQNLAGDRITGAFQVDLSSRLDAVYRIPAGREESAVAAPTGFFTETAPYPRTSGEVDLRFITADRYHFPDRAFAAGLGAAVALGFTDEPYSTAHLNASLQATVPVLTPALQVDFSARYRGYLDPGWFAGPAPASALSYLDLRGYTGTDRFAHGVTASAAVTARLPFEFYVPMSAGVGVYADAGRVSATVAGLVSSGAAEGVVMGGFIEHRVLAPFRIGSVTLSAGTGVLAPGWSLAAPWLRIHYRTGWFFSDPL